MPPSRVLEVEGIDHVALAVRDVVRSAQWYMEVLGLERRHADVWGDGPVFLGRGKTALALFAARPGATAAGSRPDHLGMLHLAFRTSRAGLAAAQGELRARGIEFEIQDHEIARSIYFPDPDGNKIELTSWEI